MGVWYMGNQGYRVCIDLFSKKELGGKTMAFPTVPWQTEDWMRSVFGPYVLAWYLLRGCVRSDLKILS
jgi:hypothetical protein